MGLGAVLTCFTNISKYLSIHSPACRRSFLAKTFLSVLPNIVLIFFWETDCSRYERAQI